MVLKVVRPTLPTPTHNGQCISKILRVTNLLANVAERLQFSALAGAGSYKIKYNLALACCGPWRMTEDS